ncbi:hypothetical protein EW026_g5946 [Hermanssonia centrifuga]|uniref:Uncharacterized protein n=1 Tax=Hermanssonia centrifuga TaxID=98765 RepID=A0A4S4KCI4_9APHY|nr:hypothetical protein EW026_g5946 [Hermanssonia centrifuga]
MRNSTLLQKVYTILSGDPSRESIVLEGESEQDDSGDDGSMCVRDGCLGTDLDGVARQKQALFHDTISNTKSEMFDGPADVIMAKAAEAMGKALEGSLSKLAETVEVSVVVLWEGVKDDPAQEAVPSYNSETRR